MSGGLCPVTSLLAVVVAGSSLRLEHGEMLALLYIITRQTIELSQEIGRRTTAVTGDPLETIHRFQRLSIAIQQANAVSFTSTFKSE